MEELSKRTALFEVEKELGAEFADFFGWQMPLNFTDPNQEALQVRENVGICDLTFAGALRITGSEATAFLQGLVSNDVKALRQGKEMRAAFLTGHGKVRAFCIILGLENGYLIVNDPQTHEKVLQYVFPFSYAGDFQVEDVSEQFQLLTLQGKNSLLVLKEASFEPVPQLNEFDWVETLMAGTKVWVMKHSRTGEQGYDLLVQQSALADVWDFLLLKGKYHQLLPYGLMAQNILRLEAALPVYGIDIDESNMLLESGLENVVSMTKGCYTGQEAVAMATYRGHVSKKLSLLAFPENRSIKPGAKVFSKGKEVGTITSVAYSATFKKLLALSCIKYGFFESGTSVEVESEPQMLLGEIVKPYLND
ncbi:MAG: aminomethyl transferase family protein [Acidobacteria bacterium]|nr:aminomethyl transferase family protein [Acidobacteriota bacterium]